MPTLFDSNTIIRTQASIARQHYPHWATTSFFPNARPAQARAYMMRDIQVKQGATYGSIPGEIQADPELLNVSLLLGIADAHAIPLEEFKRANKASLYLWRDTVNAHRSALPYVPVLVGYDAQGAPQICWTEVGCHKNDTRDILYVPDSCLITE